MARHCPRVIDFSTRNRRLGVKPTPRHRFNYSQALSKAGNRVTHICFERQIHGFILMGKVLDEANAAVAICASELRRALAG